MEGLLTHLFSLVGDRGRTLCNNWEGLKKNIKVTVNVFSSIKTTENQ